MITLENKKLLVQIKEEGAELTRIYHKEQQRECLWTADPAYWNRHAPVLFPVVGRCKNCRYRYKGKEYELGQHGFARDAMFEVVDETPSEVTLLTRSTEETRKAYPFDFILKVSYQLENDEVIVGYQVENDSERKPLYFSIGGHPGFLYDGPYEDQIFTFSEQENMDRLLLTAEGQFSRNVQKAYVKNGEAIAVTEHMFDQDALVFHNFQSSQIGIINCKTGHGAEMDLTGFPYVGLWSKPGAPFACIEPWYGLADYEDFEGELPEKDGIQMLPAEGVFTCQYRIRLV